MVKNLFRGLKNRVLRFSLNKLYQPILSSNKALKNSYTGKRCFVLGNGPSLKIQDLLKLKDEETFVVNTFWKHPDYQKIAPKNHILIDADMFPNDRNRGSAFLDEFIDESKKLYPYPKRFFLHVKGKPIVEDLKLLPDTDKCYIAMNGFFNERLAFNIDPAKILPYPKNSIIMAILLAAYMGFEKIYLLGCEHDFLAHPNHYEGFKHFYDDPKFDQNNPEDIKKYALDIMPYENHVFEILTLFRNYRFVKEKLKRTNPGLQIFNATPNSFLDVFPFVKFEDII